MKFRSRRMKDKKHLTRIFDVWDERKIYPSSFIKTLKNSSLTPPEKEHSTAPTKTFKNLDHPLAKYISKCSVREEDFVIEPFDFQLDSKEEIQQKINEFKVQKENLEIENHLRYEYLNLLKVEEEKQRRLFNSVQSAISTLETRISRLEKGQKRPLNELLDLDIDSSNIESKKKKETIDYVNTDQIFSNAPTIDVNSVMNALEDKEDSSNIDLYLNN